MTTAPATFRNPSLPWMPRGLVKAMRPPRVRAPYMLRWPLVTTAMLGFFWLVWGMWAMLVGFALVTWWTILFPVYLYALLFRVTAAGTRWGVAKTADVIG